MGSGVIAPGAHIEVRDAVFRVVQVNPTSGAGRGTDRGARLPLEKLRTPLVARMKVLDETANAVRASTPLSCAGTVHRFGDV